MKTSLAPDVKEWAFDILDRLFENKFEEVLYYDGVKGSTLNEWIDKHPNLLDNMGLFVSNGCSKICLVPEEGNWVIKINWGNKYRDYCHDEVRNYARAEVLGIENFFAKSYELDHNYLYFIEIQEKVKPIEDEISGMFYEYISSGYEKEAFEDEDEYNDAVSSGLNDMSEEERLRAVYTDQQDIDEETLQKLIDFVYDYDINDLHEGNIARRLSDGQIVLMDYSGY